MQRDWYVSMLPRDSGARLPGHGGQLAIGRVLAEFYEIHTSVHPAHAKI